MFNAYKIWSKNISTRNLVLLFLTIVFGFASVITLANVDIVSDIENARQTIGRVTITSDGTNDGIRYFDVNYSGDGRTFINTNALISQSNFSWKVLGIDDEGNLIYVASTNLVVSWAGGGMWWDGYRTGYGSDIWNVNLGNVGIGTDTPLGKLHIVSSWETDVYIEEQVGGKAANLNLKNVTRSRAIGWDSSPDVFYIGLPNGPIYFTITPLWYVGIWSWNITPKANLQVVGTFIAGNGNNTITTGIVSSIAWGNNNGINGSESFIWWGYYNRINGIESTILWGQSNTVVGNQSTMWWWWANTITGEDSFLWWGMWNAIKWDFSFIGGGFHNTISWNSNNSIIPWWSYNYIENAANSFVWGQYAKALYDNSFVRNTIATWFASTKPGQFIINVPYEKWVKWWVGINTNTPTAALDVSGDIETQTLYWANINITDSSILWESAQLRPSAIDTEVWCAVYDEWKIIYVAGSFYGCDGIIRKKLNN